MKAKAIHKVNVILWMLLILGFAACTDEGALHQQEQGYLSLGSVMVDVTTENDYMTRTLTSDPQAPSASDFLVELIDSYGTVIKQGKPQDFTSPLLLFVTTYTIRASYGDAESLISNKPYYYGETTVTVKANETTLAAPISASLQSAMVSADVSALSTHFTTTPKVYLSTSSTKVELRLGSWLYLKPEHNYIMTLEGTNQAGIAVNPTLKSWNPVKKTAYTITATPDLPILTLPNQQAGAWAKRLYITPATATNSLGNPITLPQGTVYEVIPESSSDWSAALTSTSDANGLQVITGLHSNTSYKVRARVGTIVSSERVITTENESTIPNGNMETWSYTDGPKDSWPNNKVYWQHWYARNETSETTDGWCTRNGLTTSGNKNHAYKSNSGTERTSTCYSGSYAAEIKTIGWGDDTTAASPWSTIKEITPGELFLGHVTDINSPFYGYPFSSRPSKLVFYYKYIPSGDHSFTVEFIVKDENNNTMASELFNGTSQSEFIRKEIVLNYNKNCFTKVATLCINFNSGTNSKSEVDEASVSRSSRHTGNKLYIDDISLIYD